MQNMDEATKKLRKYKTLYFASLLIPLGLFVIYSLYSLWYTPAVRTILINQLGGVYISEDLTKSNVSQGEVKQFLADAIKFSFTYNYINFSQQDKYEKKLSKEIDSDLPDHRDAISPYYSRDEWKSMVTRLEEAPWIRRFYYGRYKMFANMSSPPLQSGQGGWYVSDDKRLNIDYEGDFFVRLTGYNVKDQVFKIEYKATLERKTMVTSVNPDMYYFAARVPVNTFEWRIKSFDWKATQRY